MHADFNPFSDVCWQNQSEIVKAKPDDFTSHVSSVPFKWIWEDGSEHPMSFFGGVLGAEQYGDYFCPRIGWAVGERTP